jgi:hypothetical protein
MSEKPWFMFPYTVPFGNPNYDSGYGGSHDLDIGAPPNYPVTNLLGGTIASITEPSWGKQVGIKLDSPYNGNAYCHFLHLSAVNPGLDVGFRVTVGTLIGWVGGATDARQYNGTSNPTGENFLNDPSQSSQVQVGFALSHGPEYGIGLGWIQFPPIDWSRDGTPIIEEARKVWENQQVSNEFMEQAAHDTWNATGLNLSYTTGIAHAWHDRYVQGHVMPPPSTKEWATVKWDGTHIVAQQFGGLRCEWDGSPHWYKADGGF